MAKNPLILSKLMAARLESRVYPDEAPLIDIWIKGRKGKRKSSDEKRLTSLVNTIAAHSPFGRAVLEDAAKDGFILTMENQKDSCGFCDNEAKIIALNPALTDALLVATLAHESRHAQQFSRGAQDDFGQFNVRSELMYTRAMEADAETAAAATCHEIRVNGKNPEPWKDFSEDSVDIAAGFLHAASDPNGPVNDKMLKEAFNGWYKDTAMMTAYEEGYIMDTMKYAMRRCEEKKLPYNKTAVSEEVVNLFCTTADGKCYWADNPKVLEDENKLSIDPITYHLAETFFKTRQIRTGMAPDPSLETLKVRFNTDPEAKRDTSYSIRGPKRGMINMQIASHFAKKSR